MIRRLLTAAFILLVPAPLVAGPTLPPELLLHGNESVAYPDGPAALLFNPAALGVRYPSELALTMLDSQSGADGYRGAFTAGGFRVSAAGTQDRTPILGLGLAGGRDRLRLGLASEWIPRPAGGRVADHRLGTPSRARPWLSFGAVVEHLNAPRIEGVRQRRDYTLGVALRPLALS